jgi:hypothetical protein
MPNITTTFYLSPYEHPYLVVDGTNLTRHEDLFREDESRSVWTEMVTESLLDEGVERYLGTRPVNDFDSPKNALVQPRSDHQMTREHPMLVPETHEHVNIQQRMPSCCYLLQVFVSMCVGLRKQRDDSIQEFRCQDVLYL